MTGSLHGIFDWFMTTQTAVEFSPHSGPMRAYILAREDAIRHWRELMGPTKVFRARYTSPATIRAQFGLTDTRNTTHGSGRKYVKWRKTPQCFLRRPTGLPMGCPTPMHYHIGLSNHKQVPRFQNDHIFIFLSRFCWVGTKRNPFLLPRLLCGGVGGERRAIVQIRTNTLRPPKTDPHTFNAKLTSELLLQSLIPQGPLRNPAIVHQLLIQKNASCQRRCYNPTCYI